MENEQNNVNFPARQPSDSELPDEEYPREHQDTQRYQSPQKERYERQSPKKERHGYDSDSDEARREPKPLDDDSWEFKGMYKGAIVELDLESQNVLTTHAKGFKDLNARELTKELLDLSGTVMSLFEVKLGTEFLNYSEIDMRFATFNGLFMDGGFQSRKPQHVALLRMYVITSLATFGMETSYELLDVLCKFMFVTSPEVSGLLGSTYHDLDFPEEMVEAIPSVDLGFVKSLRGLDEDDTRANYLFRVELPGMDAELVGDKIWGLLGGSFEILGTPTYLYFLKKGLLEAYSLHDFFFSPTDPGFRLNSFLWLRLYLRHKECDQTFIPVEKIYYHESASEPIVSPTFVVDPLDAYIDSIAPSIPTTSGTVPSPVSLPIVRPRGKSGVITSERGGGKNVKFVAHVNALIARHGDAVPPLQKRGKETFATTESDLNKLGKATYKVKGYGSRIFKYSQLMLERTAFRKLIVLLRDYFLQFDLTTFEFRNTGGDSSAWQKFANVVFAAIQDTSSELDPEYIVALSHVIVIRSGSFSATKSGIDVTFALR